MNKTQQTKLIKWMDKVVKYKSQVSVLDENISDIGSRVDSTHVRSSGIAMLAEACESGVLVEPFSCPDSHEYIVQVNVMYNNHLFFCLMDSDELAELRSNNSIVIDDSLLTRRVTNE